MTLKTFGQIPVKALFLSLMGLAFFLVFVQAGSPSLDGDSVHYASVAKEIVRSQRWLLPYDPILDGPYYFHLSLSVWVPAVMFQLFGVSVVTAKLYSMLMTLLAVVGIFLMGRILADSWVGWCAGLSFLLTNHVLRIARNCRLDLPLIAFIVWAFLAFALAQKRSRAWYILYGLATLGAIMTKEVMGLVPLGVGVAYFILLRQWRRLFDPAFWASWLLAFGPVVGISLLEQARYHVTTWYLYQGQMLIWFMLEAKHLTKPWYYYGWAVLDKYWYLLPLTLVGAWLAVGKIRKGEEPRWLMVLLWAISFPLGLSFARHKVHYYMLPSYAATALLVGLACERIIRPAWRPGVVKAVVSLGVAGAVLMACFPIRSHRPRFAENVRIAPRLDAVLSEAPGEMIVVRQDVASLLFYSQVLTRVTSAHGWPQFRDLLSAPSSKRRYCLIGKKDWELLDPGVQAKWQTVLDDVDRLLVRQG